MQKRNFRRKINRAGTKHTYGLAKTAALQQYSIAPVALAMGIDREGSITELKFVPQAV